MKKISVVFVSALLFGFLGLGTAGAVNCAPGDLFNTANGQPCSTATSEVSGCLAGYLFSPVSGKSCGSGAASAEVSFSSSINFTVGSRGEDVRSIQQILKNQGYSLRTIDGVYGPRTSRAVSDFQEDNNLPVTGNVDASTLARLNTFGVVATVTAPSLNQPFSITFPNASSQLQVGQTYNVTWKGSFGTDDRYYNLSVVGNGMDNPLSLGKVDAKKGYFTWQVPQNIKSMDDMYLLQISLDGTSALSAYMNTDSFKITPSVTVSATLPTYEQIAALSETLKKDLVCGQKGDVNGDGHISKHDYVLVHNYLLGLGGLEEENVAAADVVSSGELGVKVSTLDSGAIASYLLGRNNSFTGCVFVPKDVPASCGTKGDANVSGKIDNNDIVVIRKHILGSVPLLGTHLSSGDVNGLDGVTTLDITLIRRYLLGVDSTFPVCTQFVQPSVTITPTNWETAVRDSVKKLEWSRSGSFPVGSVQQIRLGNRSFIYTLYDFPVDSTQTSYNWTVGVTSNSTFIPDNSGYKIQVLVKDSAGNPLAFDESSYFIISTPITNTGGGTTLTNTVTTPPAGSKVRVCGTLGDMNNDGYISSADSEKIRTFVLGSATPTDDEKSRSDTNGSGSISTLDISYITGYLAGNQTTFPGCVTANQ